MAAKNTAVATLTFSLMLTWRGNSRARIPATASAVTSHQSGWSRVRGPAVPAKIASATRPTPTL